MRHDELLTLGERLEKTRDGIVKAQKDAKGLHVHVSITDPMAAALVAIDQSLVSLDNVIGESARRLYRERLRARPHQGPDPSS